MPDLASHMSIAQPTTRRTIGRWMVSFLGFPLGGFTALLIVGGVDTCPARCSVV